MVLPSDDKRDVRRIKQFDNWWNKKMEVVIEAGTKHLKCIQ